MERSKNPFAKIAREDYVVHDIKRSKAHGRKKKRKGLKEQQEEEDFNDADLVVTPLTKNKQEKKENPAIFDEELYDENYQHPGAD